MDIDFEDCKIDVSSRHLSRTEEQVTMASSVTTSVDDFDSWKTRYLAKSAEEITQKINQGKDLLTRTDQNLRRTLFRGIAGASTEYGSAAAEDFVDRVADRFGVLLDNLRTQSLTASESVELDNLRIILQNLGTRSQNQPPASIIHGDDHPSDIRTTRNEQTRSLRTQPATHRRDGQTVRQLYDNRMRNHVHTNVRNTMTVPSFSAALVQERIDDWEDTLLLSEDVPLEQHVQSTIDDVVDQIRATRL